jgi:hypothetical protein
MHTFRHGQRLQRTDVIYGGYRQRRNPWRQPSEKGAPKRHAVGLRAWWLLPSNSGNESQGVLCISASKRAPYPTA